MFSRLIESVFYQLVLLFLIRFNSFQFNVIYEQYLYYILNISCKAPLGIVGNGAIKKSIILII